MPFISAADDRAAAIDRERTLLEVPREPDAVDKSFGQRQLPHRKADDLYKASYFANYARIGGYHPPYVELASGQIEWRRRLYSPTDERKRGVPAERLVRHDLRLPMSRRFDIALLTEVVEHVEPIFSSQVVLSAVLHAE